MGANRRGGFRGVAGGNHLREGRRGRGPLICLLGPAFVASLAYVDPGNVGANLSAGQQYGYALVWVLVGASAMASLLQYQSAKLGLVTGKTLTKLVGDRVAGRRHARAWTWVYGGQAFVMAIATDLAEVVGGALGLYLLFGTPLWLGGLITGGVTIALLSSLRSRGEKMFEAAVAGTLAVVVAGFLGALAAAPPEWGRTAGGLVPHVPDPAAWSLIAAMLGATVMPHAIYLHSRLAIDRHRPEGRLDEPLPRLLHAQKLDVGLALVTAGAVNVAMLLLGATLLEGLGGDTVEAAHAALGGLWAGAPAIAFGVGLLASGIGSAVVGTHAGAGVLNELLPFRLAPVVRRLLTVGPAVLLLATGISPTEVLVVSQAVLSFGIALALIPLALLTGSRAVMGAHADAPAMKVVLWSLAGLVVALNVVTLATL
ncbi:MAG: Nramp family divalent metal transporter [Propionibacteriaceae bacterium]|nr:Nramp family divalent metal transporter [Propionibacteriaceae bacterium]